MEKDLEYYLAQTRRIAEHREQGAEAGIRKTYKALLKDLQHFISEGYAEYAEDDKLTVAILNQKRQYARFLEETEKIINDKVPEASKEIQKTVQKVYSLCYDGMAEAVRKSNTSEELSETFKSIKAATPQTIKEAVQNPITGLTLSDTLEKNRKEVVYEIKKQLNIGLINGDSYPTMAKRISDRLDMDYRKATTIVRTESHRVQEAGFSDSAEEINNTLKEGVTAHRLVKTWKSMHDERVRKTSKANHRKMDGVSVGMDEEFDLGHGIKAKAPSQSGDAANDINCRCFLKYELKEVEEIKKSLDKNKKQEQPKKISNNIVQGNNISTTWERREDKFDFEIEDIINAQGFDGLPRVVSAEEFEKAVKKSHFVAQRTYSASSQEVLDEYRKQLYNGKWYVDCGTGGAQYGQGMYCAADYEGNITDGIKAEMKHYQEFNVSRGAKLQFTETLTLDPSAKIIKYNDAFKLHQEYVENFEVNRMKETIEKLPEREKAVYKRELGIYVNDEDKKATREAAKKLERESEEEYDKIAERAEKLRDEVRKEWSEYGKKVDVGGVAAMHGYDAINADGHGESGSYTVILNRTKVIFKENK